MTAFRAPIRTARLALLATGLFLTACGDGSDTISAPETSVAPSSEAVSSTTAESVDVPVADDATDTSGETSDGEGSTAAETTASTVSAAGSDDAAPSTTASGDGGESDDGGGTNEADETTTTTAVFTSSPPASEDKVGCPEGTVLVGSNGEEPICSEPASGCPEGYRLIGGDNGQALCQDDEGNILRVSVDGTITPDTSVPFNGPVCRRLDADGNLVGIGLATSQQECEASGGEYLPDGL